MKMNKKENDIVECIHLGDNKRLTDEEIINKIKFKKTEEDPLLDHIEEIHYFMNKITAAVNNNAKFLQNLFKKVNSKSYLEEHKFHNYLKNVNNSLAYDENQNESYLLTIFNKSYNERILDNTVEDSIKSNLKFMNILSSLEKENKLNFFDLSKKQESNLAKIEEIEKNKLDVDIFQSKIKEINLDNKELNSQVNRIINEKTKIINNDLNKLSEEIFEKYGNLEKNCLWKIKDFEELLKTRVNEIFVNKGIENCEERLLNELKELQKNLNQIDNNKGKSDENIQNDKLNFSLMEDKINNLKKTILKINTKIDNFCTVDQFDSHKKNIKEKIEIIEINFKDNNSITKTFIDKYEEIQKRIVSLYENQKIFKKFENQISSKFNLLMNEVNNVKIISEKYNWMKNYENIVQKVSNNENIDQNILIEQPKFTNNNNSLNINEWEELKEKIINEIEENFERKLNNYDDTFLKFKLSLDSQNDTILRLQNEVFYKISKEEFENSMQLKLGKEEFYEINNKNIKELEKIELVNILSNKTLKKVKDIKKDLEKKFKKIKSKLKSFINETDENIKNLKENEEKVWINKKNIEENSKKFVLGFKDILGLINDLKNEFDLSQNEKKKTLATTKPLICLSCGENEPKLIPPTNFIKGADGKLYQTDINFIGKKKNPEDYVTGQEIITREEIIKGHTIQHHLPIENLKPGTDIFGKIIGRPIKREPKILKKNRPISEMKTKKIKNRLIYK